MKKYKVELSYGKSHWGFTDVLVGDDDNNLTDYQIINLAWEQFKVRCNSYYPHYVALRKAEITERP